MFPESEIRNYLNDLTSAAPFPGPEMFADAESPSGAINGSNTSYILAHIPNPSLSLILVYNGLTLTPGIDFTLSSATITMAFAPNSGDRLEAWYRY